jgi:hypothetical protein
MNRALLSSAVVLLVFGCKSRQSPDETKAEVGVPPVRVDQRAPDPAIPEKPVFGEEPAGAPTEEAEEEGAAAEQPGENLAKPPRDLAGELRAAVGSPVDCLQDYQPSTSTIVRVSISAIVRPSGLIIDPSASARGLSVNDRKCIEQRVGDVVLAALDAEASQPVSTYIDLSYQRPIVEEADVGGPAPKLKEVTEPLPKKETLRPSGVPIQKAPSVRPEGPQGVPIQGREGVPVEGPKPRPIQGYEVEEDAERWTD